MNPTFTITDILPDNMNASQLLSLLRKRIKTANGEKTAIERGISVKNAFPELAEQTIQLAEESMKGMLVLPGTEQSLFCRKSTKMDI